MPSLQKLMGGAMHVTLSGSYQMGGDPAVGGLAHPRVLSFDGSGSISLPSNYFVPSDGRKFFLINQTGGSVPLYYNTFPLVGMPGVPTLTPVLLGNISAGNVATVSLYLDSTGSFQKWNFVQRAYGSVRSVTYKRADGAARVALSAPAAPPAPFAVPPPYFGSPDDYSSCNTTYSVALSGGTGDSAIWNGTWTVTKSATSSPYYWRYVIDKNHWVDLRGYPDTLYDFKWQVVCIDLTKKARRRFACVGSTSACPSPGLYVQFNVPSENTITSPTMTCTVT